MKKISRVALILLMLTAVAFAMIACPPEGDDLVNGIRIDNDRMPRTTFVVGTDLDLSNGQLTVTYDNGDIKYIALDADGVKVNGYNKNTLGAQELTIEYEGFTTKLSISVVRRIQPNSNVVLNYVIGEEFSRSAGQVTVTKDDGTSVTVALSDSRISIEGFDSSRTGTDLAVKIKYYDPADTSWNFEDTLAVNVYDITGTPIFNTPNNTAYYAYDTELDLAGGYISFQAGPITKQVLLTEPGVTVTGYDFTEAMDRGATVEQTVTVSYLGRSWTYKITVTFDNVSKVKRLAATLDNIDWTDLELVVTFEQGENALEAAMTYISLSATDKARITKSEIENIALGSVLYGQPAWSVTFYADASDPDAFCNTIAKTIGLLTDGNFLLLEGATHEDVSEVYTYFSENDDLDFYRLADILSAIAQEETLSEVTFKDPLLEGVAVFYALSYVAPAAQFKQNTLGMLEYVLDIYDTLSVIPDEYEVNNLNNYASEISSLKNKMERSNYSGPDYRNYYAIISSWRENDDLFDILYSYYYYVNRNNNFLQTLARNFGLPGTAEALYQYALNIKDTINELNYQNIYDTVGFMIYFKTADELIEIIENGDDEMLKYLLTITYNNFVSYDDVAEYRDLPYIVNVFRHASFGYYDINFALQGVEEFHDLWDTYIQLVIDWMGDPDYNSEDPFADAMFEKSEHQVAIKAMFDQFIALTPNEQLGFIVTLDSVYRYLDTILIFDVANDEYMTTFAQLIKGYYTHIFSNAGNESAQMMFEELIQAIEAYDRHEMYETNGLESFFEHMEAIISQLTYSPDKDIFMRELGTAYNKYLAIYNLYDRNHKLIMPKLNAEWTAKIDNLLDTIDDLRLITFYVAVYESDVYSSFYAAYLNMMAAAKDIMDAVATNNDLEIVYRHALYELGDPTDNYDLYLNNSLEYLIMIYFRSYYIGFTSSHELQDEGEDTIYLMDVLESTNLGEFIEKSYTIIKLNWNHDISEVSVEEAQQLMKDFRALTAEEQRYFLIIDEFQEFYHVSLGKYFYLTIRDKLEVGTASIDRKALENTIKQLFDVEYAYIEYQVHSTQANRTAFNQAVDSLKTLYGQLESNVRAEFDSLLGEVYNYYINK